VTFEKPPTVRLEPCVARECGLTPTRVLKRDGVHEAEFDVPFLGYVGDDDTPSHVRLFILGHGPREFPIADVTGLNVSHRVDKPKKPRKANDKQIDLEDWLAGQ
jgi:hypothetical protein